MPLAGVPVQLGESASRCASGAAAATTGRRRSPVSRRSGPAFRGRPARPDRQDRRVGALACAAAPVPLGARRPALRGRARDAACSAFPARDGFIPPAGCPIVVSYVTGGGVEGNVPAGAIRELRSSVGFVQVGRQSARGSRRRRRRAAARRARSWRAERAPSRSRGVVRGLRVARPRCVVRGRARARVAAGGSGWSRQPRLRRHRAGSAFAGSEAGAIGATRARPCWSIWRAACPPVSRAVCASSRRAMSRSACARDLLPAVGRRSGDGRGARAHAPCDSSCIRSRGGRDGRGWDFGRGRLSVRRGDAPDPMSSRCRRRRVAATDGGPGHLWRQRRRSNRISSSAPANCSSRSSFRACHMPLPKPTLDSRCFDQLVSECRALLSRVAPGWTDHNASDPGITLLELGAWLGRAEHLSLRSTVGRGAARVRAAGRHRAATASGCAHGRGDRNRLGVAIELPPRAAGGGRAEGRSSRRRARSSFRRRS